MSSTALMPSDLVFGVARPVQVFFVDLLLAGDNAMVIALFCRALPPAMVSRVVAYGTLGAILLRLLFSFVATSLLALPGVSLVGAVLLVIIAANLVAPPAGADDDPAHLPAVPGVLAAGLLVALLDLIMSIDNVLALVAVSAGSMLYLAGGILCSIPLLMSGTLLAVNLLRRFPWLVDCGGAVLGWIAGSMLLADPLLAGFVNTQSPALLAGVPAALAFFIFRLGWGVDRDSEWIVLPPVAPVLSAASQPPVAPAPIPSSPEPKAPEDALETAAPEPEFPQAEDSGGGQEIWWFVGLFVAAGVVIFASWFVAGNFDF